MGKVLKSFNNGYVGAVSRSVDDIIIALANKDGTLGYGVPVVMNSDGTGAIKFNSTSTAADLVGFTVRSASKTPATYGSSLSSYASGEMMDVMTRGSTVVYVSRGAPKAGSPVYVIKASGLISGQADGDNTVELTNVRFRSPLDSNDRAEIVILERNLQ